MAEQLGSLKKEVESSVKSESPTLELKTLKDMNYFQPYSLHNPERIKKQLRTEAIKWANFHINKDIHTEPDTAVDFIKEFFNLTEEELK